MKAKNRNEVRKAKHRAQRRKLTGTVTRPRLGVFKSNKYTYAFLVNDQTGQVLVSRSTREFEAGAVPAAEKKSAASVAAATRLGLELGQAALTKGCKLVVFDRSGYPYHGRVKAVADGARQAGLNF